MSHWVRHCDLNPSAWDELFLDFWAVKDYIDNATSRKVSRIYEIYLSSFLYLPCMHKLAGRGRRKGLFFEVMLSHTLSALTEIYFM